MPECHFRIVFTRITGNVFSVIIESIESVFIDDKIQVVLSKPGRTFSRHFSSSWLNYCIIVRSHFSSSNGRRFVFMTRGHF